METLRSLLLTGSVAQALFVLSLVAAMGLYVGRWKVFSVKIGIVGVLFSGLLVGHLKIHIQPEIMDFVREFGLALFVYAIGLQVGPGFFDSLRKQGLKMNILAAIVVVSGAATAFVIALTGRVPFLAVVGLYSGAVTNTPSLGAAQQVLKDLGTISADQLATTGMGYALAYPLGILGIVLTMLGVRFVLRVDPKQEASSWASRQDAHHSPLKTLNLEVTNPNLEGKSLRHVPGLGESGVVVSRIWHSDRLEVAGPETMLHVGDVLLAVGPVDKLNSLLLVIGRQTDMDLRDLKTDISARMEVVTRTDVVGRTLEELNLGPRYGVAVTRIRRGEVELAASPTLALQFGDAVLVVGREDALVRVADDLGNSQKRLEQPPILPIFIGLVLGVFLGSIPIPLPGVPISVKLGLAGGPLIVAMMLARLSRLGPVVWYMPGSANFTIRELGIVLFLSCVGLRAGDHFVETLLAGGWVWMLWGILITLVPLIIGAIVARLWLKMNYLSLCGWLSGCMTDPPALAYAASLAPSDASALAYATVYPLVMLLRVLTAQVLVILLLKLGLS